MSWLERLRKKQKDMKAQMQRGYTRTMESRMKRDQRRRERNSLASPGTFRHGITNRVSIGDFMKDVDERRKRKREEKENKKED